MYEMSTSMNTSPSYCRSPIKKGFMRYFFFVFFVRSKSKNTFFALRLFLTFNEPVPVALNVAVIVVSDSALIIQKGGKISVQNA